MLRNLVAEAAYLATAIRLSPTIFFASDVQPREEYDEDEHKNLDDEGYSRSKKAVVDSYSRSRNAEAGGPAGGEKRWERTHRALTQIAIWPSIKRFLPGSGDEHDSALPIYQRDGMRIVEITPACVASFYGQSIPSAADTVRLGDWIREKAKEVGYADDADGMKGGRDGNGGIGIGNGSGWMIVKGLVGIVETAAVAAVPCLLFRERFAQRTGVEDGWEMVSGLGEGMRVLLNGIRAS